MKAVRTRTKTRLSINIIIVAIMLFGLIPISGMAAEAAQPINVVLNGQALTFDVSPNNINGRIMVPMRIIFEALGANIEWDEETATVTATTDDLTVKVTIHSPYISINGIMSAMDVAPVIADGRTLVPVRFVSEAFGAEVSWDESTSTVNIRTIPICITVGGIRLCPTSTTAANLIQLNLTDEDIVPLRYLKNLKVLSLDQNNISDITPLAGLTNLRYLSLSENRIIDVTPLAGLTNLEYLWLEHNSIRDATPLMGLVNLIRLNLYGNSLVPWDTPGFRNDNQQDRSTNFALYSVLLDFHRSEFHSFQIRTHPDDVLQYRRLDADELKLSDSFRRIFIEGFRRDELSRVFPFNAEYLEMALDNVDFAFIQGGGGAFISWGYDPTRPFIHIGGGWDIDYISGEIFVDIAIHEVGHALGLGESLSYLFTELFMDETPSSFVNPPWWERNSYFDRVILREVGYREFWQAAFSSNAEYLTLIDRVLDAHPAADFTAQDLMLARRVVYMMQTADREVYAGNIRVNMLYYLYRSRFIGSVALQTLEEIPRRFYHAFDPDTPQETRDNELAEISGIIGSLAAFGRQRLILPAEAVFDLVIQGTQMSIFMQ